MNARLNRTLGIALALVVVAGAGMDYLIQRLLSQQWLEHQREEVQAQTGSVRAFLEELITTDLRIVDATAAYVETNPNLTREEFEAFASRVARNGRALRNLAAAPDLRLTYVYPREGNEPILGVSYYDLPDQLPLVLKARNTRTLVVAGPVDLVQGGQGILGRAPVFVDGSGGEFFWGVVSSLISMDHVLDLVIPLTERYELQLAIRGVDGTGSDGAVFAGDAALFADAQSVVRDVVIPNGSWQIATAPVDGWVTSHPQALVVHLVTILFVSMASLAVFSKVKQDAAVRTSEERLRDVTDSSSDLVWEVDPAGTITYLSGHAERVLGVAAGNLLGTSIFEYADGGDRGPAKKTFDAAVRAGLTLKDEEVWIASADGEHRCLLRNGRPLIDANGAIVGYRGVDKDITTRKRLQAEVRDTAIKLDLFFRQSLDGFFFMMLDEPIEWNDEIDKEAALDYAFTHQRMTKVNQAMLDQYRATEDRFVGLTPADFFAHDEEAGRAVWRRLFDAGSLHIDTDERRFDGSEMTVEGDYIVIREPDGRILGNFGIQRDVTAQRDAAAELERYIDIVDRHIITSQTDLDGTITYASAAFSQVSKYGNAELVGNNHRIIRHPDMPDSLYEDLWRTITDGRVWHGEIKNRKKDGEHYWVDADISPLIDRRGVHYGYMAVRQDITAKKELEVVSVTDRLTGLFNRQKLDVAIEDERQRFERYGEVFSVIILDIDHFKSFNDRFGHQEGDRILKMVAATLDSSVRASDVVGRWGGEEFIVLCPHTAVEGAVASAEHLRERIATVGVDRAVTASFGVAEMQTPDTDTLIRSADQALYDAKRAGRNRVRAFEV